MNGFCVIISPKLTSIAWVWKKQFYSSSSNLPRVDPMASPMINIIQYDKKCKNLFKCQFIVQKVNKKGSTDDHMTDFSHIFAEGNILSKHTLHKCIKNEKSEDLL